MPDDIKTGAMQSPYLYREVEPVAPYPRINPHQPKREKYPRQQSEQKSDPDHRSRRRFSSMRELVERLKESFRISRLDFATAEREMHDRGLAIAEELIISQLLKLKIPLDSIEEMFQQIRRQSSAPNLAPGRKLTAKSFLLFPEEVDGLFEYCLCFSGLRIQVERQDSRIIEEINANGRFVSDADHLRLIFSRLPDSGETAKEADQLELDIQILVGALEIDDGGRRAILYPRAKATFGLYADKQINLSI